MVAYWQRERFQPKTSVYIKLDLATDFLRRNQRSARGQFISLRGWLSNEVTLTARQIQRQYIQLYSRSNSDRQLDAGHTSSEFNAFLGFICLVLNNWSSFLLLHTRQQQNGHEKANKVINCRCGHFNINIHILKYLNQSNTPNNARILFGLSELHAVWINSRAHTYFLLCCIPPPPPLFMVTGGLCEPSLFRYTNTGWQWLRNWQLMWPMIWKWSKGKFSASSAQVAGKHSVYCAREMWS